MNWVDMFVAIIVVLAVINGARKGLFREIAALIAVGFSVVFAINHSDWLAARIAGFVNSPPHLLFVISVIILLVFTIALFKLIGLGLYKIANPASLKYSDKYGGGIIGALRGVILLSLMLTLLLFFPSLDRINAYIDSSVSAPYIRNVVPLLFDHTTLFHQANPSFTSKVREIVVPGDKSDIEIAKKDGHKTSNSSDDDVMNDIERRFGSGKKIE